MTRPGHISEISRTGACKHKNLVIHINTRTWGQVSRYECLCCSTDRLGRRQSMPRSFADDTALDAYPTSPWNSKFSNRRYQNFIERIIIGSNVTSGKLGKKLVRKRTLVFSASSKTFTFMLRNYVISPLGHGLLFVGISLVSRFMYNTFVTLSYQRNCIRYKSRRVAGLTSNIYTPRFHKNANIWRVVHIFGANV